jgi:hypothetical protein
MSVSTLMSVLPKPGRGTPSQRKGSAVANAECNANGDPSCYNGCQDGGNYKIKASNHV